MGITEKKPDVLSSLQGEGARTYRQQMTVLLQGTLPHGWHWVDSSKDAVVAATTSEPFVFYKEFLPRSPFEKIKSLVRGSRCRRARRQADILHAAGLPSPAILCWGQGRKNEFLLTEGFAGIGFFQFLKIHFSGTLKSEQFHRKRLLLQEAGSLIGTMHSKGIVHGDLRQNNLLVKKKGGDFQFSFIDNESNRKRFYIPLSQIVKNLSQFAICSDNLLTRTDLMRLFNSYSTSYPRFSGRDKRKLLQTVYTRSRTRILEIKVKGVIRQNCQTFNAENFQGKYVTGSIVDNQLTQEVDPAQWFQQGEKTLKDDKNITVKLISGVGGDLIAKRFTSKNLLYYAKIWLKKERTLLLWEMSHNFQALDIPVAAPLGYVLEGKGIWRTVSYFYSQYLADARDLVVISRQKKDKFQSWLAEEKIIGRMARLLATLHNNGFCHGDTKWANILANPTSGEFWLIDLDGAVRLKSPLDRRVRKDLSRFMVDMIETGLSQSFLAEFLREYCGVRRLNREYVLRAINPHIEKTLARHRKKRRIS